MPMLHAVTHRHDGFSYFLDIEDIAALKEIGYLKSHDNKDTNGKEIKHKSISDLIAMRLKNINSTRMPSQNEKRCHQD